MTYNYSQLQKLTKSELINLVVKETGKGTITGPDKVNSFIKDFSGLVTDWHKEYFIVIGLNVKNLVIHAEIVSIGHLSASLVHPREVFKNLIQVPGVAGFIVGHNHPSGDPRPSSADCDITTMLQKGGELLNIPLLDHLIFTKAGEYYSYQDKGRL